MTKREFIRNLENNHHHQKDFSTNRARRARRKSVTLCYSENVFMSFSELVLHSFCSEMVA